MTVGWKILGALLFAAACVVGYIGWRSAVFHEGDSAGYSRANAEHEKRDNKALKEALADVSRLNKVIQGISEDEKKQRDAAAVSAAAARGAGERLRAAEARLRAISVRACPAAATAPGSAPADPAAGVLADVQRKLDEFQDRTAGFADASRRAGLACERVYDSLK